jgi:hypothetical protein
MVRKEEEEEAGQWEAGGGAQEAGGEDASRRRRRRRRPEDCEAGEKFGAGAGRLVATQQLHQLQRDSTPCQQQFRQVSSVVFLFLATVREACSSILCNSSGKKAFCFFKAILHGKNLTDKYCRLYSSKT